MVGLSDQAQQLLQSLIFGGDGGAKLKSVQSGSTTLAPTQSSIDVTITAVNLASAFVVMSWTIGPSQGSSSGSYCVTAALVSTTTLRFARDVTTGRGDIVVSWMVVEFLAGASVQQVTGAISSGTTGNVTISAVDTGKTFIVVTDRNTAAGTVPLDIASFKIRAYLTSPTNLRLERYYNGGTTYTSTAVAFVVEVK